MFQEPSGQQALDFQRFHSRIDQTEAEDRAYRDSIQKAVSSLMPEFMEALLSNLDKIDCTLPPPTKISVDQEALFGMVTHLNPTVVYLC